MWNVGRGFIPDAGRGKPRREGAGFGSIFSSGLSLLTDIAHSKQSGFADDVEVCETAGNLNTFDISILMYSVQGNINYYF